MCSTIFTLATRIFDSFMDRFLMFLKIALIWCLISTVFTWIINTFMDNFYMVLKMDSLCSLIVTLVTGKFYPFMDRFLILLKTTLFCCLILDILTRNVLKITRILIKCQPAPLAVFSMPDKYTGYFLIIRAYYYIIPQYFAVFFSPDKSLINAFLK